MVKAKPQIALVYLIRIYISIHDINRIVMIDLENTCNTVGVVLLRSFSNNVIVKLMWFATRSFLIVMSIIDHKVSPQPQTKTTRQQPQHPPCGKTTLRWGGTSPDGWERILPETLYKPMRCLVLCFSSPCCGCATSPVSESAV